MYIEVAAHRGNRKGFPENTLPAFESAYSTGADMIELDMRMTADGEIVVIHDPSTGRVADLDLLVRESTLGELKKADLGVKSGDGEAFRGTRIPTFREFLEMTRRNTETTYNFELKNYYKNDGAAFAEESADKTIAMIDEYGLRGRCVINSFDGRVLDYVDKKYGGAFRLHGYYPYAILGEVCPKLYCTCLFHINVNAEGKHIRLPGAVCPRADFEAVRAEGVRPWVGADIVSEEDVLEAVSYGAELITTNDPVATIKILEKAGYRQK